MSEKKEVKAKPEPKESKEPKAAKAEKTTAIDKKGIKYHEVTATCACGAEIKTGSTMESIRVDICSNCHPFFTGEQRLLDTEGRIDKFRKKYNKA